MTPLHTERISWYGIILLGHTGLAQPSLMEFLKSIGPCASGTKKESGILIHHIGHLFLILHQKTVNKKRSAIQHYQRHSAATGDEGERRYSNQPSNNLNTWNKKRSPVGLPRLVLLLKLCQNTYTDTKSENHTPAKIPSSKPEGKSREWQRKTAR